MANADSYKRLLEKIQSVDLGSGGVGFWKPEQGRSTVRILPPIGGMDFFFKEVGVHYLESGHFYCPVVCTDGKDKCPICEVNQALYDAGEKELAGNYRVRRAFWMNVIVRGDEKAGPRIYTPGVTVFSTVASYISDPEFGDITDIVAGFDVKIDREGTGLQTEYQVRAARLPTPLSEDEDDMASWLENATDVEEYVAGRLKSYDALIEESGVSIYFADGADAKETESVPEPEQEPEPEPDDQETSSASARIEALLAKRKKK